IGIAMWHMPSLNVAAAVTLGVCKALDIVLIIFGAVLLLNVMRECGLMQVVTASLFKVTPDRRIQVLLIAWLFSGLIEGAAGFGAAPALVAPLLAGLGFPVFTAVVVALVCNTLPVPFGAVGTPVLTLFSTMSSEVAEPDLFARGVLENLTLISGISGIFIPLFAVGMMIFGTPGKNRWRAFWEITPLSLLAGALFIVPWRLCAIWLGPELPSIMGAVAGLPLMLLVLKLRFFVPHRVWDFTENPAGATAVSVAETVGQKKNITAIQAWMPYILLAGILLLIKVDVLPFKSWINRLPAIAWRSCWGVPESGFCWNIFNNPGVVPLFLLGGGIYWYHHRNLKGFAPVIGSTVKQIWMASLAIIASMVMVQVMIFSRFNPAGLPGMLNCVAQGCVDGLGRYFLWISPFLGVLGTFVAGSCTVSNILFAPLQFDTAQLLGLPETITVALQNVGGGLGSMIRISGVIAACATVNLKGQEGKIIFLNMLPTLVLGLLALGVGALLIAIR
ncbi:MAG: L-lactate permease, partial [Lentisphaeria bacterium]|nr:L-lactate permease [Lentisphaeria bacterium]